MVIGIKNSMNVGLIFMISKTARNSESVCPKVNKETKIKIRFQALVS